MNNLSTMTTQTMSSLEIAKLTGKQHKHVLTDIRNMLKELDIRTAEFSALLKSKQNKNIPCYNLPKRETLILVSGYNIKMRAAIIDRWQELESQSTQQSKFPPQFQRYLDHKQSVPNRHFIALEIVTLSLIVPLSSYGVDIFGEMMPEGSFVRGWNKELRACGERIESFPTHKVQTNKGVWVPERCYPDRLYTNANSHFWSTWLPDKAPRYLKARQVEALPAIPNAIPTLESKLREYVPRISSKPSQISMF